MNEKFAESSERPESTRMATSNDLAMDVFPPILPDVDDDVNRYDVDGMTPLIHAIREFKSRTLRQLLGAGADVNARNHDVANTSSRVDGFQYALTPLQWAVYVQNVDAMELLIEDGAVVVNAPCPLYNTLLHMAFVMYGVDYGRLLDVFRQLVDAGCDVSGPNSEGKTVLMIACKIVRMLHLVHVIASSASARTSIDSVDQKGRTALYIPVPQLRPCQHRPCSRRHRR